MDEQNSRTKCDLSQPDRPVGLLLRRTEQVVIASCLLIGFVAMAGYFVQRGLMRGRFIEIERAEPVDIFVSCRHQCGWLARIDTPAQCR